MVLLFLRICTHQNGIHKRNANMNIYIPPTLNKTISQKIFFWSLTVCCCLAAVLFLVAILWLTQAINDVGFN